MYIKIPLKCRNAYVKFKNLLTFFSKNNTFYLTKHRGDKMKYDYRNIEIRVLPSGVSNHAYLSESSNVFRLDYAKEKKLYSYIKDGNLDGIMKEISLLDYLAVGKLSEDELRQFKYTAVSFITLAVRWAIEGGLPQEDAFSFSDIFIQKLDSYRSTEEIFGAIMQSAISLINSVSQAKTRLQYSPHIRRCIDYINKNLDKKITVTDLAEHCGISNDYLSHLFKNELGEKLSDYILKQKLDAAAQLLADGLDNAQVCYALGFSSQSYFIAVFKRHFGLTPRQYLRQSKSM